MSDSTWSEKQVESLIEGFISALIREQGTQAKPAETAAGQTTTGEITQ